MSTWRDHSLLEIHRGHHLLRRERVVIRVWLGLRWPLIVGCSWLGSQLKLGDQYRNSSTGNPQLPQMDSSTLSRMATLCWQEIFAATASTVKYVYSSASLFSINSSNMMGRQYKYIIFAITLASLSVFYPFVPCIGPTYAGYKWVE